MSWEIQYNSAQIATCIIYIIHHRLKLHEYYRYTHCQLTGKIFQQ